MELRAISGKTRALRLAPWACLVLCLMAVCVGLGASVPFYPEASGVTTKKSNNVTLDISNADKGYIMVKHKGSEKRLKVRVTYGDQKKDFDLNGKGEFEVYPLVFGSGKYKVEVFQNTSTKASSTSYTSVMSTSFTAQMPDENSVFLCPNQYIWYTQGSQAVQKSYELCNGLTTDREKFDAITTFVSTRIAYDYIKAATVQQQKGYLPNVDDTLSTGFGICFDYSALAACMLRVQGIPTQLVVGDLLASGNVQKHAWNKAYVDGQWVFVDTTFGAYKFDQKDYVEDKVY